ncbi:MAG: hypothetical protein HUU18_11490 [Phycisphaerales bacterium]|nr:hypothetical protein [Phycisphaerales bacterium]
MTMNKWLLALMVLVVLCLSTRHALAQHQPTGWDPEDATNKTQTRQYLSLIWQAQMNGQPVDMSQFVFTNALPEVMSLLVGPQREVFESLYVHRLDPHGLAGAPYGLNDLLRDDAGVRAQFREFVLTDKITLGPDADPEAAAKHLLMIMDGIFAQSEYRVESFQINGEEVESTNLELVKYPGELDPLSTPLPDPSQFECDLRWWVERSFFECMANGVPRLFIPEINLDPEDPNGHRKFRPVPRFDGDDITDAMIQWLLRRLEALYGPGSFGVEHLVFTWQCPDYSTTPPGWRAPVGHSLPLIERGGKYYLIDPSTGEVYGPFNTREEAYRKALALFMTCPGGRALGNPEYWPPGFRPEYEPSPWWTDWEMQRHFCQRLAACCGTPIPTPPTCPPSTIPGGLLPSMLTPCNFRDYMPRGTYVDPRAECN